MSKKVLKSNLPSLKLNTKATLISPTLRGTVISILNIQNYL